MSNEARLWVKEFSPLMGTDYAVHFSMADSVDDNNVLFMNQARLAAEARVSLSTAKRAVSSMLKAGLLERVDTPEQEKVRRASHGALRFRMLFPVVEAVISIAQPDTANDDQDDECDYSIAQGDTATPNPIGHTDLSKRTGTSSATRTTSHPSIDVEPPDPVADAPMRDSLFQTEPQEPTPTVAEIFWQEQTGAAWEEFWQAYPRHKAAEASRVQFFKTARGVDVRVLIREAKVYADLVRSENRIAKYVCSAENWLLKKRWLDPRDETPEELLARQLAEMEPSNRNGHDVH